MLTVKAPDRARRYGLKPTKACQSWSRGSVTHFPQVPNVGDMIEGSCQGKTPRLRVSSICYTLGDLVESDLGWGPVKQGTIVEIWLDNVRL